MAPVTFCLTGPECTGKTTLAGMLAAEHGTIWVPEYARQYALEHPRELTAADVEPIARGQIAVTDLAPPVERLVLDTDLISTVVYARHYYGSCPGWIVQEAARRRADEYLLLGIDFVWVTDGVRDAAQDRVAIHEAFRLTLAEFGAKVTLAGGAWEARAGVARRAADGLFRT